MERQDDHPRYARASPRRFAADLLDRFRDLIVLAAVPDAAEIGLLDLSPDRAELMAAQAGRFGQAGLTRAAEIVSTGLDQMRGATSPRLLLELMCAQVLLPAAATDEKSLLARLERLESAGRGGPPPVPQAPPRAPHSGQDDDAERSQGASPAERRAPEPTRSPASAPSSAKQPAPAQPAPAQPAPAQPSQPAAQRPSPASPSPGPGDPGLRSPGPGGCGTANAGAPAERAAGSPGLSATESLRQNWDAVLEAVKQERRVAWMLLSNATVLSMADDILTLRFPRDGDLKGFSVSGHDAVLKRVLSARFGLNVTVKGVAGGDAPAGAAGVRPGRAVPAPGPGRQPPAAAPEFAPPDPAGYDDEPPDDMPADEMPADEPSPGDRPVRTAELTGMDLIQRELGGQVIGEIEG